MNAGLTIFLGIVAVLASALAVAAGTNESLAVPAAVVAVAAGAFLLAGAAEQTRWPHRSPHPAPPADPAQVRSSLEAGVWGRPSLIALLDDLERAGGRSGRTSTSAEELARLEALSPNEFREYLATRVGELERQT